MGTDARTDNIDPLTPRQRIQEAGELLSRAVGRVAAAENTPESSAICLDLCSTMPPDGLSVDSTESPS